MKRSMYAGTVLAGVLALAAAACGGRGGGGTSDPCDRLSDLCSQCSNAQARAQCFQAVNLDLDSTCQQLLDSGTYAPGGVECGPT
jgi:hypothetical protein